MEFKLFHYLRLGLTDAQWPQGAALLLKRLFVTMKHELVDPHRKRVSLLASAFCNG